MGRYEKLLTWGLAAAAAMLCPPAATAGDLPFVERFGLQPVPQFAPVSDEQEQDLLTRVREFEFPQYLYSGCDERAHAAWMLLPPELQARVHKIWIVTPAMYTYAIPGAVRSSRAEPAYRAVDWGYHVALAYQSRRGLRIIDAGLRPGESLTREQWLAEMALSPLTFWTMTEASVYRFYTLSFTGAINESVWNGNSYRYDEGTAGQTPRDKNWIPDALARDAVGADAVRGTTCAAFRAIATQPQTLLDRLRAGPTGAGDPCRSSFQRFTAERQRWIERLSGG
ncbi:MAG TPA: protein-glutamine glutaminase family protein [Allosphingosinicella sp.]|jgi:hypothetical protein